MNEQEQIQDNQKVIWYKNSNFYYLLSVFVAGVLIGVVDKYELIDYVMGERTIENKIEAKINEELSNPMMNGAKLLSVEVIENKITLNFSEEIVLGGGSISEERIDRIFDAIDPIVTQYIKDKYYEILYEIQIEGQSLNEYWEIQETRDWKTYRNEKLGFELKYPPDWQVEENYGDEVLNSPETMKINETPSCGGRDSDCSYYYDVRIGGSIDNLSAPLKLETEKIILGLNNVYVKYNQNQTIYYVEGAENIIVIETFIARVIADRILSTFKFIETSTASGKGTLSGHVDIGPFCPVEQEGVPCPVPPEAYSSVKIKVYKNSNLNSLVSTANVDGNGGYTLELNPGEYFVIVESPYGLGGQEYNDSSTELIQAGKTATLNFTIDTGIR